MKKLLTFLNGFSLLHSTTKPKNYYIQQKCTAMTVQTFKGNTKCRRTAAQKQNLVVGWEHNFTISWYQQFLCNIKFKFFLFFMEICPRFIAGTHTLVVLEYSWEYYTDWRSPLLTCALAKRYRVYDPQTFIFRFFTWTKESIKK